MESPSQQPDSRPSEARSEPGELHAHPDHHGEGGAWTPRPNDHHVEPFFGGLGAEPTEAESGSSGSLLILGLALAGALLAWWVLA